jgi:hypothetical protein
MHPIALPGDNAVTVSSDLTKRFAGHFKRDRENRFNLFMLAFAVREKYLNKETNEYEQEFRDWYETPDVEQLFGKSLSNFTKYASAGEAIHYVGHHTRNPTKYLQQLPVSMNALYEISQIIKADKTIVDACFEMTPVRRSRSVEDQGRKDKAPPLIHPHVTAAELAAWRQRWENPEKPEVEQDPHRRTVKLLTISVSDDIFAFDKGGNKIGALDMEQVLDLVKQIEAILSKTDEKLFRLDTKLEKISQKYKTTKENSDPEHVLVETKKGRGYKND